MHIYRTMVPGSGVLHQILTRDGESFCLLWTPPTTGTCSPTAASSMSPPERSCSNPTRPIRWPSFWLTDRLPIASSRWNDGSTN